MSTFSNPILFSSHFNISPEVLLKTGLIDPFLTVDTQLFIEPILLEKSGNKIISSDAYTAFKNHFQTIIRLLTISEQEGDAPWVGAQKQLSLKEPPANGLGYGVSDRHGSSRPDELRDTILRRTKEIIKLGSKDPEMISLMGFFEENVGPDTISDLTSRIIEPQLAKITHEFCVSHGIPMKVSDLQPDLLLPHFKRENSKERAIVLVPSDIVRELPVANDWSGVEDAINANAIIRASVNRFLGGIATPTVTERKEAVRKAAFESADIFDAFIAAVKENTTYYDPTIDVLGYYKLKQILLSKLEGFKSSVSYDLNAGIAEIKRVVNDTLEMFAHHIEKGNLWEALWVEGKPKKERAAQLIYFAIADCYCKANNIDISPEANMGGGPIDFKYSKGYRARVLIEMKKSTGTVVNGYEKQLEIYKEASRTTYGVYVVLDYGGLGDKLLKIEDIRKRRLVEGNPASDIIVIDATRKVSASKRQ